MISFSAYRAQEFKGAFRPLQTAGIRASGMMSPPRCLHQDASSRVATDSVSLRFGSREDALAVGKRHWITGLPKYQQDEAWARQVGAIVLEAGKNPRYTRTSQDLLRYLAQSYRKVRTEAAIKELNRRGTDFLPVLNCSKGSRNLQSAINFVLDADCEDILREMEAVNSEYRQIQQEMNYFLQPENRYPGYKKEIAERQRRLIALGKQEVTLRQQQQARRDALAPLLGKFAYGLPRGNSARATSLDDPRFHPYLQRIKRMTQDNPSREIQFSYPLPNGQSIAMAKIAFAPRVDVHHVGQVWHWVYAEPKNVRLVMAEVERLYQHAMRPDVTRPDEVLRDTATIHWLMAQACPYLLGSAAITDMMTKVMLDRKGIETQAWRSGVTPDCEALVTPLPDYIQRYPEWLGIHFAR